MPEPRATVSASVPPSWPVGVPWPQAGSVTVAGPGRTERNPVLIGATRLRVRARTASMQFGFTCWLTPAQMQAFEDWYRVVARDHDGEFYAPWVGGARVLALLEPYEYSALGKGYALSVRAIRTRIDERICDAFINAVFGGVLRDDGLSSEILQASLGASDIYADDFPLKLIAENEC